MVFRKGSLGEFPGALGDGFRAVQAPVDLSYISLGEKSYAASVDGDVAIGEGRHVKWWPGMLHARKWSVGGIVLNEVYDIVHRDTRMVDGHDLNIFSQQ